MSQPATHEASRRPPVWAIGLAFAVVCLAWGTSFLPVRVGARAFPPALFAGVRVCLAGALLLLFLAVRREDLRLTGRPFLWIVISGLFLKIGFHFGITVGEETVGSGLAAVLVATVPCWMALLEVLWPWGDRLRWWGWLGLLTGVAGVVLLFSRKLETPEALLRNPGPLVVLGAALSFAVGSFIVRYRRPVPNHLVLAGYQMFVGGGLLTLLGLLLGEGRELAATKPPPDAVAAFFYLLVVNSLIGFVTYNWLLGHTSLAVAGSYGYVVPLVAVLTGALFGEAIPVREVAGMAVILAGVALVGSAKVKR